MGIFIGSTPVTPNFGSTAIQSVYYGSIPVYTRGTKIESLSLGSIVKIPLAGIPTEFMVVNQGVPGDSSAYGPGCDGCWILAKDIYTKIKALDTSAQRGYTNTDLYTYLTDTFPLLVPEDTRAKLNTATIPYRAGNSGTTVSGGTSGLQAMFFLLSKTELGGTKDYTGNVIEGAKLDYFESPDSSETANALRVAYYQGAATQWWTRTPKAGGYQMVTIGTTGSLSSNVGSGSPLTNTLGIRPCMVVKKGTLVDADGNLV